MKYFITGASGFIGGSVARQLVAAGHQVVALARTPSKANDLAKLGVQLHAGDITNKASMRAPMTGVDGVFHLAAWYKIGVRDKRAAERINVQGTRNVLELMRDLQIPKGVYTSTVTIFSDTHGQMLDESYRHNGPWLSEYDRTKWLAHYSVALPMIEAGLPLVIVQPGATYGPGDTGTLHDLWVQYLQRRMPMVPRQTGFSWAYVDDTARGHLLAMERGTPGESYIIAGPPYTLIEALDLAAQITGVPAPSMKAAPGMLKATAAVMGAVERVVPLPPAYSAEYLRVSAGTTYMGDNAKARRDLGLTMRPLEEGLRETLRYEMAQLGMSPQA